jgi:hypothetical protein
LCHTFAEIFLWEGQKNAGREIISPHRKIQEEFSSVQLDEFSLVQSAPGLHLAQMQEEPEGSRVLCLGFR